MRRWPVNKAYVWEQAPFFRLLLPLIIGILCYDRDWLPASLVYPLGIIAFFLLLVFILVVAANSQGIVDLLRSVSLHALIFLAGWFSYFLHDVRNNPDWFGNQIGNADAFIGKIMETPVEKEKTWKINLDISSVISSGKIKPSEGKSAIYVYKTGSPLPYHKGDRIMLPPNWKLITNGDKPYQFDYARFAARQNLYYRQFLSADQLKQVSDGTKSKPSFIDYCHDAGMNILHRYITDQRVLGLIQAILIGDDVHLDGELLRSYSDTGIVHIIAISGSHIVIFFVFVSGCFFWLRHKKYDWIKYLFAIPLIWCYVLMAGSPPSAVRAAVMFSLLALGIAIQKNRNPLNQLLATAFIMLLYDPSWLFAIGFQLSFIAVLSLMLFFNRIYKALPLQNPLLCALWKVMAASIAAEILVAPLVIYYFHLLPAGFLIANVLAWFFMGLVLLFGMAIIVCAHVPWLAKTIAWLTTLTVQAFDQIILWLQGLNPESFTHLYLTTAELCLVYIIITAFSSWIIRKNKYGLFAGLGCICVFLSLSIHNILIN